MTPLATHIQTTAIDVIETMLRQGNAIGDDTIDANTYLVRDLAFASIDFIELIVNLEEKFNQKLGFYELLVRDGTYVDDLTVRDLVSFIQNRLNGEVTPTKPQPTSPPIARKTIEASTVTPEHKRQFCRIIDTKIATLFPNVSETQTPIQKNPPVVFILSPPRSGSTLLRVILGGHPRLFAPPELHLLSYPSLDLRQAALSGEWNQHLLQGTLRSLVQLKNCTMEVAEQYMHALEQHQVTTISFYRQIQQQLGDRLLVDKTPTYACHSGILQRAETYFSEPLYIHLWRHPCGMMRSYEEAKLDRVVPFTNESSFSARELAELTWLVYNENASKFLQQIPQHRQFPLKFEDLVSSPQATIEKLCAFLGVTFHPDMLQPYKDKNQRMTDGVTATSMMSGDLKFHLHQGIDPEAANRWQQDRSMETLSDMTRQFAATVGYGNG
jgi:acyl carrier protein